MHKFKAHAFDSLKTKNKLHDTLGFGKITYSLKDVKLNHLVGFGYN